MGMNQNVDLTNFNEIPAVNAEKDEVPKKAETTRKGKRISSQVNQGAVEQTSSKKTKKNQNGRKPKVCAKIGCKKKLNLSSYPCRCGGLYCALHMTDHDCTFDYHKEAQKEIEEHNPKIVAEKIKKI